MSLIPDHSRRQETRFAFVLNETMRHGDAQLGKGFYPSCEEAKWQEALHIMVSMKDRLTFSRDLNTQRTICDVCRLALFAHYSRMLGSVQQVEPQLFMLNIQRGALLSAPEDTWMPLIAKAQRCMNESFVSHVENGAHS